MKVFLFFWFMLLSCFLCAGEFFESITDAQNAYIEENYIEACDQLKDAIRFSWEKVDLQARNVHFIKGGASGFENYTAREESPFISGEEIHVYLEPIGFTVKKESDGYVASLTADYRLVDANKNVLAEEKGFGDFEYKEISFFTDVSLNMNFGFEGLVEGKYTLEITIRDKLSGKNYTAKKDFEFVKPYYENNQKAIGYLQNSKFLYRDLVATYAELSTTYAFTYENPKFIGWETSPDPDNPVATLVTIKFQITGVPSEILNAPESEVNYSVKRKMKEAVPLLRITWRVNDLIDLKITPYNFYAKDALEIYKDITDGLHKLAK